MDVYPGRLAWLLMWLLPSMVLMAFPFAMGFVVDGVRRHAKPTQAERMAMCEPRSLAVAVTVDPRRLGRARRQSSDSV